MSDNTEEKKSRYVSIKEYARLCGVGYHAIHSRVRKSESDIYKEGDPRYLELVELEEVEGEFIDTDQFPPTGRFKPGAKKKK